jgi:hypothetical protein
MAFQCRASVDWCETPGEYSIGQGVRVVLPQGKRSLIF